MDTNLTRPGRPLGLSLAIILSVGLYCLLPLLQLGAQLFVQDRISRIDSPIEYEGEVLNSLGSGGSMEIVSVPMLLINGGSALLFLVAGVAAWRGGRSWLRLMFSVMVIIYASITAIITLRTLLTPADIVQGVSSADTVVSQALCGRLTATILIPLYVLWIINRAPSRAFFRGTYAE